MNSRASAFAILFRMFATIFGVVYACSLFWNSLSGRNMLPLDVVFWVAVVLTVIFVSIGWGTVTVGSAALLKDDPEFHEWKGNGGRPYLDSLPWPVNPDSPERGGKE